MDDGIFKYEDCLLKHHVRVEGWLPVCKRRQEIIRDNARGNPKKSRRLRYFTFCAVGAIDVLMLDVAKVIRPSKKSGFDNVVFFDKTPELVFETQKRIPGAIGFAGDFVNVVLLADPKEEYAFDGGEDLEPLQDLLDKASVRKYQTLLNQKHIFIDHFPFDVINLDLEEFLFKPNDTFPGKVINALRKVFSWQQRPLMLEGYNQPLDGFSLMFTTQIGPPNISEEYLAMLLDKLDRNLRTNAELEPLLIQRTGIGDAVLLRGENFEAFFRLAMPKVIVSTLLEEDWYIDPDPGVLIFEFERQWREGTYKMLHLVMDVKRKVPPKERRAPGQDSQEAVRAYHEVIYRLFAERETVVTEALINQEKLQESLDFIKSRRKSYYPEEDLFQI